MPHPLFFPLLLGLLLLLLCTCDRAPDSQVVKPSSSQKVEPVLQAGFPVEIPLPPSLPPPVYDYDTTQWTEVTRLDTTIRSTSATLPPTTSWNRSSTIVAAVSTAHK